MNTELKKHNVLLLVTGSVAAIKVPSIIEDLLSSANNINIICVATQPALHFLDKSIFKHEIPVTVEVESQETWSDVPLYTDDDEWKSWNKRGDPVLHIELRKWAHVGVIVPLSANSLAKITNVSQ